MAEDFDLENEKPETVGETGSAVKAGRFHASILEATDTPCTKEGVPFEALQVKFSLENGTSPTSIGEEWTLNLYPPGPNDKEYVRMLRRNTKLALAMATGLLTRADFGRKGVTVNWSQLKGRQCCIVLELNEYKDRNGKMQRRLQIAAKDPVGDSERIGIYHVHDPLAADIPKDEQMAAMVPPFGDSGSGSQAAGQATANKPATSSPATSQAAAQPAGAAQGGAWAGL